MTTKTIAGTHYETVIVSVSNTTFEVTQDAVIYGGGDASGTPDEFTFGRALVEDITNKPHIKGNTYSIDGRLSGLYGGVVTYGDNATINIGKHAHVSASISFGSPSAGFGAISASGEHSKVTIAQGGVVSGTVGVVLTGANSVATNNGQIIDGMWGMVGGDLSGGAAVDGIRLVNNGSIDALVGMTVGGADATVINGAKGEILAYAAGIAAAGKATIANHGTIRVLVEGSGGPLGASAAIFGADGVQKVTNDGTIIGHVALGAGNDSFNTIGGVFRGKVYGGEGNDTFFTDNAKYKLVESGLEGTDTVRSTVSYKLSANVENLVLLGAKNANATGTIGDNGLQGNKGDNVLTGLHGIDTFHFGTKGGTDTIADLELGVDKIDLSGWKGIADIGDVRSHARNHGADVWITLGEDVLIVEGHTKSDLNTVGFDFA
jgi:hypothetical protein